MYGQELEPVAGPPAKQPHKYRVCENNSECHLLSVKPVVASHHLCGLVGLDLWFEHNINACIIQNWKQEKPYRLEWLWVLSGPNLHATQKRHNVSANRVNDLDEMSAYNYKRFNILVPSFSQGK